MHRYNDDIFCKKVCMYFPVLYIKEAYHTNKHIHIAVITPEKACRNAHVFFVSNMHKHSNFEETIHSDKACHLPLFILSLFSLFSLNLSLQFYSNLQSSPLVRHSSVTRFSYLRSFLRKNVETKVASFDEKNIWSLYIFSEK